MGYIRVFDPVGTRFIPSARSWKQGQKFTAVALKLMLFPTFLDWMEESACAALIEGSSAIPHASRVPLCHGSPTLGENELSKKILLGFIPPLFYSIWLFFSLSSICTSHTSILYYVEVGALNPALPLFGFELMYTTLQLSKTGNIFPPFFFLSEACCSWFLWNYRAVGTWDVVSWCVLISRHGSKLQHHGGHLLYFIRWLWGNKLQKFILYV